MESFGSYDILESEQLLIKAEKIEGYGIDGKDALHIACGIEGKADLFFTTDSDIIKRGKNIHEIKILNPVQFFIESEYMEDKI